MSKSSGSGFGVAKIIFGGEAGNTTERGIGRAFSQKIPGIGHGKIMEKGQGQSLQISIGLPSRNSTSMKDIAVQRGYTETMKHSASLNTRPIILAPKWRLDRKKIGPFAEFQDLLNGRGRGRGSNIVGPNILPTIFSLSEYSGVDLDNMLKDKEILWMNYVDYYKRMIKSTAFDILNYLRNSGCEDWKKKFEDTIVDQVVFNASNNNSYRIDGVHWECTPASKFTLADGQDISFVDFYKNRYGLEIKDLRQPLLRTWINPYARKKGVKPEYRILCLIPEFSLLKGVSQQEGNPLWYISHFPRPKNYVIMTEQERQEWTDALKKRAKDTKKMMCYHKDWELGFVIAKIMWFKKEIEAEQKLSTDENLGHNY